MLPPRLLVLRRVSPALALTSRPTSARTFGVSLLKSRSSLSSADDSGSRALLPGSRLPVISQLRLASVQPATSAR
jgi:hypothetical protein